MTKPGLKPAPSNVRRLRGDRPYRYNDAAPIPPEEYVEEPPEWLSESARAQYEAMVRRIRALRTGPYETDAEVLIHLAVAADTCQRLAQVIVKAPAVVRDANGSPIPNPLVARYERAVKHMLSLCTEFGLTPSSRERAHAERFHEVEYDDIAGGPSR
jgi:P27 family predicted phage terminase small subunit